MHQTQSSRRPTSQEDGKNARRHLKMMTFGAANLSFLNVLVTSVEQSVELVKRASNRRYIVKTDGRGLIDIEYDADDKFTVALYNHSRWVTNLYVDSASLDIGNVGKAQSLQVATSHITKNETRNVHTTFKVENRSDAMLKRLDVRGYDTTWFSVFSHNANMLMARPNGDWVAEKMVYLIDQMTTQAINNYRRSNGNEILSSVDTVVMRRRQTTARTMQASALVAVQSDDHPDAREIELLKNERVYEQRAMLLDQN